MAINHEPNFDAAAEIPVLHNLAVEHIRKCRACCERASRHHLNVEPVLTDVQSMQALESANNILEYIQKLLSFDMKTRVKEGKFFYIFGAVTMSIASAATSFLLKLF